MKVVRRNRRAKTASQAISAPSDTSNELDSCPPTAGARADGSWDEREEERTRGAHCGAPGPEKPCLRGRSARLVVRSVQKELPGAAQSASRVGEQINEAIPTCEGQGEANRFEQVLSQQCSRTRGQYSYKVYCSRMLAQRMRRRRNLPNLDHLARRDFRPPPDLDLSRKVQCWRAA